MSQNHPNLGHKPKITASQRLTVPLGFLHTGVSSGFVHRRTRAQDDLRRTVLLESLDSNTCKQSPVKSPLKIKNQSKSLIRELEEKCSIRNSQKKRIKSTPKKNAKNNYYKEDLLKKVEEVNLALIGRGPLLDKMSLSSGKKGKRNEDNKENIPVSHLKVPESKWVFHTPPNPKLNFKKTKIRKNAGLEVAVLGQNCNKKTIYGIKNKDFCKFPCGREVKIDDNMMELDSNSSDDNMDDGETNCLERHFVSLSCRPKKRQNTQSRFEGEPRCKRDMFEEAACSTTSMDSGTFDINNEESYTFKFTPSSSSAPGPFTVARLFDRDGNEAKNWHFQCD